MTAGLDLIHQVVNLVLTGTYLDIRIQQTCRTDHLFHHHTLGLC